MPDFARRIDLKAIDRDGHQIPTASFQYWINDVGPATGRGGGGQSSVEVSDPSAKVHVQARVGEQVSEKVLLGPEQNSWAFRFDIDSRVETPTTSGARRWWVAGAVVAVLAIAGYLVVRPKTSGVGDRWMLLREPAGPSLTIGTMWDGTTLVAGCYSTAFTVDTLGGSDAELSTNSAGGDVALQLLGAIGLEQLGNRVGSWSMHAWSPRIYSAVNPSPILRDECAPQRDGLPRYPMITALLGYDSVALRTTGASTLSGKITAHDTAVLRKANASIAINDSSLMIRHGRGLIFGFRALGVQSVGDSTCKKEVAVGEEFTCGAFPYAVTAAERFPSGQYRVTSMNRNAPNSRVRSDTLELNSYATLGLAQGSAGTFGDWYSLRLAPSTSSSRVELTLRRLRYSIVRFESEADRASWRAFIH